jgi:hypothetical protein
MSNQPQKPAAVSPEQPKAKAPRRYFLVNPKGAIHEVTREHARERLKQAGWRMANTAEIEELERRNGLQVFDRPICRPWSPDPDEQLDLVEE